MPTEPIYIAVGYVMCSACDHIIDRNADNCRDCGALLIYADSELSGPSEVFTEPEPLPTIDESLDKWRTRYDVKSKAARHND